MDKQILNCPNCAAPMEEWDPSQSWAYKCKYCGTTFWDFAAMDIDSHKPFFMRLKIHGAVHILPVTLESMMVSMEPPETVKLYADNNIFYQTLQTGEPDTTIEMIFRNVPNGGWKSVKYEGKDGSK